MVSGLSSFSLYFIYVSVFLYTCMHHVPAVHTGAGGEGIRSSGATMAMLGIVQGPLQVLLSYRTLSSALRFLWVLESV